MAFKSKAFPEQTALVTGGGTGIGRAFAEALVDAGMRVVIAARRRDVLHRAAEEMNKRAGREQVFPYGFDLRSGEEIAALVEYTVSRFGAVDVLINNSGLAVPESVTELSESGWNTVMDTNLRGPMQLVRAVLPHMLRQDFGDVVNVSSQAGKNGYADVPSYCASKWGLLGYAESLRDHVRKTGANIRVFNLCPGLVEVGRATQEPPRPGFIHVGNMARTLMFALSLDRDVVLQDVSLYAR